MTGPLRHDRIERVQLPSSWLMRRRRSVARAISVSSRLSSLDCSSESRVVRVAGRAPTSHELSKTLPLRCRKESIWAHAAHEDERVGRPVRELCRQGVERFSGCSAHGLIAGRHGSECHLVRAGILLDYGDFGHGTGPRCHCLIFRHATIAQIARGQSSRPSGAVNRKGRSFSDYTPERVVACAALRSSTRLGSSSEDWDVMIRSLGESSQRERLDRLVYISGAAVVGAEVSSYGSFSQFKRVFEQALNGRTGVGRNPDPLEEKGDMTFLRRNRTDDGGEEQDPQGR